jgi:predicted ATPase/DNA-binding CsgD family transcriptional regulator
MPDSPEGGALAPVDNRMHVANSGHDWMESSPPLVPTVGREDMVDKIVNLVLDPGVRLLTLTGAGGIGKTHLAVAAARTYRTRSGNRAIFVSLSDKRIPRAVDCSFEPHPRTSQLAMTPTDLPFVSSTIDEGPLLLVLDGFEHLTLTAPAVSDLLAGHPDFTVLATSRRPLRIEAERLLPVSPLPVPGARTVESVDDLRSFASGRLFLEAATVLAPEITIDDSQARSIAAICDGLDGSPLAILLAARRLRALSPDHLAAALDNPLDLADAGPVDAPSRLRSMRGSIAWSHDLLADDERTGFRRLGIFPDTFTLDAAVCLASLAPTVRDAGDAMDVVSSLVEQSLLQRCDEDGGNPRYRLDPVTRAFARERLVGAGELSPASQCLATWCVAIAEHHDRTTGEEAWLRRLSEESDNLRVARQWIRDTGAWRLGFRLVDGLYDFWLTRGCSTEERRWLQDLLDRSPTKLPTEGALRRARVMHLLGLLSHTVADFDAAERAYRMALDLRRRLPDRAAELDTQHNLAVLAASRGDYEQARTLFEAPVALARTLGDRSHLALSLCYLASVQNSLGDHDQAWKSIQEAGSALRRDPTPRDSAYYLLSLGEVIWSRGLHAEAQARWEESLRRYTLLGETHAMASALVSNAALAVLTGSHPWAGKALGAGDALIDEIGAIHIPPMRDERARIVQAVRNAIGDHALETVLVMGQGLAVSEAIAAAMSFASSLLATGSNASPQSVSAMPPDLTPRERDVLNLLVAGKTNREIGDVLCLGHRTIATHVSNLLAKFDVSTRAAAASAAVRLGMVDEPESAVPES